MFSATNAEAFGVLGEEAGLFPINSLESHGAYEVDIHKVVADGSQVYRRLANVVIKSSLLHLADGRDPQTSARGQKLTLCKFRMLSIINLLLTAAY